MNAFIATWKDLCQLGERSEKDNGFTILRLGIKTAERVQVAQISRALLHIFMEAWSDCQVCTEDKVIAVD